MDNSLLAVLIIGGLVSVSLLLFESPVDSAIPPTPAFQSINGTDGNVTAITYNDNIELVEGSGILIDFDYLLDRITISSSISNSTGFNNIVSVSNMTNATIIYDNSTITNKLVLKTISAGEGIQVDNGTSSIIIKSLATASGFTNISSSSTNINATVVAYNSSGTRAVFKTISAGSGIQIDNGTESIIIKSLTSGFSTISSEIATLNNATILAYNNSGIRASFKTISAGSGITIINGSQSLVISSSGPVSLPTNVTSSLVSSAHTELWSIPLTANSGNSIHGIIVSSSNTSGSALQVGANTTVANSNGWCVFRTPTSATAEELDILLASTANIVDTGTTTWQPAVDIPQPISFDCTITSGVTPGNIRVFIQAEVASTVSAKAGSFYLKTP